MASRYGTLLICAASVVFCGESPLVKLAEATIGVSHGLASEREKRARMDLMKVSCEHHQKGL